MPEVVMVTVMMASVSWAAPGGAREQRGAQYKGGDVPGSLGRHL